MKKLLSLILAVVMAFSAVQLAVVTSYAEPAAYVSEEAAVVLGDTANEVVAAAEDTAETGTVAAPSISYMFSSSLIKDLISLIKAIKTFINNGLPGLPEFIQNMFNKKDKETAK